MFKFGPKNDGQKNFQIKTAERLDLIEQKFALLADAFMEQLNPADTAYRDRFLQFMALGDLPDGMAEKKPCARAGGDSVAAVPQAQAVGDAAALREELENLRARLQDCEDASKRAVKLKAELEEARAAQNEADGLKGQLADSRRRCADLEKERDALRAKLQDCEDATGRLKADLHSAREDASGRETKLKAELEVAQGAVGAAQHEAADLKAQIAHANRQCEALGRELEEARKNARECGRAAAEAQRLRVRSDAERDGALADLEDARRLLLRDQTSMRGLQDFLDRLAPDVARIIRPYFDCGNLVAFLAQCGQFNRLNQFWEACGKAVATGADAGEFAQILHHILDIYNMTSDSPAELVLASPGDPYNTETQLRVKSDGSRVRKLLLPGLRNAGGRLVQLALVTLE